MSLLVEALRGVPMARRRIELVERKGVGHPDTVCDSLVEAISLGLNRMYLARVGVIPHYNIDKALLVAGQCRKDFGGGAVTRPMELVVGDRATFEIGGRRLPVEETARTAVNTWIAAHLPRVRAGVDLVTRVALAPGSEELRGIYGADDVDMASNDTCGASGYAPWSPTEELVFAVEEFLNGDFKRDFPDTGQDVKVFAARADQRITLTVAMPLLADLVPSETAYFRRKDAVLETLRARFASTPFEIDWALNSLDHPGLGSAGTYLTVTGTSAEDADSGQVGRGNRANGLIAFSRPTGGEAAAGKNPLAHTGKIYSVLSHRLATLIHRRCPGLAEVYVHLAARIGQPVSRPWTAVQVVPGDGLDVSDVESAIREVVEEELAALGAFRAALARGDYRVC